MKGISVIIILIFASFNSVAQKIEMLFYPAFHNYSRCYVTRINDSYTLQLDIFKKRDTNAIIYSETDTIPLELYQKLINFFEENIVSDRLLGSNQIGLDGIEVIVRYKDDNEIKEFKFWSPEKTTNENKFCKTVITTLRKFMKNKNSKRYLRVLKMYF
jgi:hypothetical protein